MKRPEHIQTRHVNQQSTPLNEHFVCNLQTRRSFMHSIGIGLSSIAMSSSIISAQLFGRYAQASIGVLQAPDANGVRLPVGFTSRIVAHAGRRIARGYRWHFYPDGGATFATDDGGWIYVSNSETASYLGGGASAIRFNTTGAIVNAYRILSGTDRNCAGGSTPWGTWLSCEEIELGRVYECDPFGTNAATPRDALGYFKHEAVAVDTKRGHLYMTEDQGDGRLYRFVPNSFDDDDKPDLNSGLLQVAKVNHASGAVSWLNVPDPVPDSSRIPTRKQVPASSAFKSGEGICYHDDKIYFSTKGDGRVWRLMLNSQTLTTIYDEKSTPNPVLTGVDNLTVFPTGDLLVAEDGGDMQIVTIDVNGNISPLLQVVGQDESEITGPAFSPDGSRLYFSSQRGSRSRLGEFIGLGLTYEVIGPFSELFAR